MKAGKIPARTRWVITLIVLQRKHLLLYDVHAHKSVNKFLKYYKKPSVLFLEQYSNSIWAACYCRDIVLFILLYFI